MRQTRSPTSHTAAKPTGYHELAIAHIRAHGGQGVVLVRPGELGHKPQQWRAWQAYFASLGGLTAKTVRGLRQITVPAEWPLEFDASAPGSPAVEPAALVTADRRREVGRMLRSLVPEGDAAPRRPAPFSLRLEEDRDAFADRGPLTVGSALRRQPRSPPPELSDDDIARL